MRTVNLPTDLLRTFVTVIEVESFTRAAELLGRTQPAVSLQIQRLEQLVGQTLILREGKETLLTERGESLVAHARQILRLNDLAVAGFDRHNTETTLRIGLPVDYAVTLLQANITTLIKENPQLTIEIRCDLSKNLIASLRKNEIDIAVALFDGDDQQFLFRHWLENPTWVGAEDLDLTKDAAIPLIVHPYGCVYRDRMTAALKSSGASWRVAYSSPGIGGVQQAVQDGLGLTCLTGPTIQPGMRFFTSADGLPALPPLHIGLFARQAQLSATHYKVVDSIVQVLEENCTNAKTLHKQSL
jgi:DNA-binding transcriptional LysR family regulator